MTCLAVVVVDVVVVAVAECFEESGAVKVFSEDLGS